MNVFGTGEIVTANPPVLGSLIGGSVGNPIRLDGVIPTLLASATSHADAFGSNALAAA